MPALGGLRRKAIAYRRLQALLIASLAALIAACAVLTPLYDRSLQQAYTGLLIHDSPVSGTGVTVTSPNRFDGPTPPGAYQPLSHGRLVRTLPASSRALLGAPIAQSSVRGVVPGASAGGTTSVGDLVARSHACDHLRFAQGACPRAIGEVAISEADTRTFDLHLGQRVSMTELALVQLKQPPPTVTLRIVGIYRFTPSAYWFDRTVTGLSGTIEQDPPNNQIHDVWFAATAEFDDPHSPRWQDSSTAVDFPIDPDKVGADQLIALGRSVHRIQSRGVLQQDPTDPDGTGYVIRGKITSGLPDLADLLVHARKQGRETVPLLMVQLGLLSVLVLWLVLGAATGQRRPEIALARLRGYGVRGARRLLLRELLPVVLAGTAGGCVLAFGLDEALRRLILPGDAALSLTPAAGIAVVAAVVVLVLLTWVAAFQVTRQPVDELLRRVPPRRTRLGLGAGDATVVAAAGTAGVAFLTGGLRGPLAVAAPTLLAVVVGLLLAHLAVPVAARAGRALLRRGRYADAVAVLATARRPSTRRIVAIVTVATSLLVFASEAVALGVRNRERAAEQQAGAPMVVPVDSGTLTDVRRTLAGLHDRDVTPVLVSQAIGDRGGQTVAVDPDAFRRIGWFAGADFSHVDWPALAPPKAAPIDLTGTAVSVPVSTDVLLTSTRPIRVGLSVQQADGTSATVDLGGVVPNAKGTLRGDVPCAQGCRVVSIDLSFAPGASGSGTVRFGTFAVQGGRTDLPGGDWETYESRGDRTSMADGRLSFRSTSANDLALHAAWAPAVLPALVAVHNGKVPRTLTGTAVDGTELPLRAVGSLPRVPGVGLPAEVIDLDVVTRAGSRADPDSVLQLWFADERAGELTRVRDALAKNAVTLGPAVRTTEVRRSLDRTIPAWALQLGVLVGVAGLLLAALVLLVVAATTWRGQARDLAALRMSGTPRSAVRRIAGREQVAIVALAVLAGAICGAVSAKVALPSVPLFVTKPSVSTLDYSTPWLLLVAVAAGTAALLVVVGLLAGRAIAARASYQRVRETL